MSNLQVVIMLTIFAITVIMMLWRPRGVNEWIPTAVSAVCVFLIGIVPLTDVLSIGGIVSGAAITILSTIVMSIVLESIGFFRWAAINLAIKANGSGYKLFWYINLLCFLMTLFFNNDGSILITTPIIIQTLTLLKFKPEQQFPYLISGALVATASSAPIGVSNLANLIALNIVELDINTYAAMMFVPSMLGIICIPTLLYFYFKNKKIIPSQIPTDIHSAQSPLFSDSDGQPPIDWALFRVCISIVILTRISFFVLAPLGVPTEWPAIMGALVLILIRWYKKGIAPSDVLKKTPWSILIFAFSMYVLVYGLHNTGMTEIIINQFGPSAREGSFNAVFIFGLLLTVLSNICNNLPSIMIGTFSVADMGLDVHSMQVAYLGNVIGADIGSLILPIGTLATLIWIYTLRRYQISIKWVDYVKVTILVIPISLIVSLLGLYLWTELFFL
ncbi:arsenite efflux membrane protein ArsB [Fontibacillus panacisegetis]|uniref:Arsenite efflux membrane protein ArsB n=1 Tax=Fontibacillus panacisegetis TaxID=670482 RepID=A0A1G7TP98_9BACL|nr:arsenic transporter [Fontibacillus panacisegetis]SDG37173.1 arsenite efflux membrane protein ArsB [Fontibacillus panacisegetis]